MVCAVASCKNGSKKPGPWRDVTFQRIVSRLDSWIIILSTVVYGIYLAEPDTVLVLGINFGVFGVGTRLAMPKTIYAPDSSSLKPGSGATEGFLDKGVSGQPDYVLWLDCWTAKIQD